MATPDIDFTALYSRHLDFVWRNLRALGVPAAELDDATQDTFVVAYRRRDDFRAGAMRAWLYGIARRVAYRQRRGGGRRARLVEAVSAEPRNEPSLEAIAEDHQAWEMALAFLDTLPEAQREAFWLTEIEGLTAAQAGAALGVSGNTISSRLRAARQAVARHGEVMQARDAGELQRALRRRAGPTPTQRRSVAAAVAVRLGALTKSAPVLAGLGLKSWIAVAGAMVGIAVGAARLGESASTPSSQPLVAQTRPAAMVERAEVPTPAPEPRPIVRAPIAEAPSQVRPRRASKPTANTLAAEAKLVRAIKGTVADDPARALSLVAEHGRRFPDGVLTHEATVLRVQAACALGRVTEAARASSSLPAGHAWASGCPDEEKPTNPVVPGEDEGI